MPGKLLITCSIRHIKTTLNIANRVLVISEDDDGVVGI
ncbi:hypothetical protein PAGA_a2785 [Pseudoalteromonas agarivorans DSM 14585]|uniref:Uncharacterized protein n=1 Tax=Pseudoalteromonas agarivorans DSM 14585 TaxID=1312369 RepID=A0ACA8DY77_9GAMM|nr:hypothetical protein PAGA_a2785 [Pseudoalteromonas agarivorans DSM 14585]